MNRRGQALPAFLIGLAAALAMGYVAGTLQVHSHGSSSTGGTITNLLLGGYLRTANYTTVIGSASVYGRFDVGGSTLNVRDARVGVGTAAPGDALDVAGAGAFTGTFSSNFRAAGVYLGDDGSRGLVQAAGAGGTGRELQVSGNPIILRSGTASYADRLYIGASGAITSVSSFTVAEALQVQSGANILEFAPASRTLTPRGGGWKIDLDPAEVEWAIDLGATSSGIFQINDSASAELFRFQPTGEFGVNVTAPVARLHIEGPSGTAPTVISSGARTASSYSTPLRFTDNGDQYGWDWRSYEDRLEFLSTATGGGTAIRISTSTSPTFVQPVYVGQGTFTLTPKAALHVGGGLLMVDSQGTEPTCDSSTRGLLWYNASGAGVKDNYSLCAKDAADAYAWRTIY